MSEYSRFVPVLFLPETIYAASGIETNIYFANVWHAIAPENYAYEITCEVGRQDERRWHWIPAPEDAGKKFKLTIDVFDDHGWVTAKSCWIQTAPVATCPNEKITLALLGDSLVNSQYPEACRQLMVDNGFVNYTPVGTWQQPTLTPGRTIAHDGLGGFSWRGFLEQWSYSKRELSLAQEQAEIEQMKEFGISDAKYGEHLLKSPLLRLENGQTVLDIPHWFERINQGKAPDVIVIELGGNDSFGCIRKAADHILKERILSSATTLLDELRKYAPRTLIGVATLPFGGSQDGFGENYGCKWTRYSFRKCLLAYNRAILELVAQRHDPLMKTFTLHHNVDPVSGYIYKEKPRNARSQETVMECVNGVHPSVEGGLQIADAVYCWLTNQLPLNK